jgi:hypothetical protein
MVNYRGTNVNFSVPDPQAASRLVIPLPTVSVILLLRPRFVKCLHLR